MDQFRNHGEDQGMKNTPNPIETTARGAILLLVVAMLGGCITGNEAQEAMEPDPQKEMTDLQMDHDIGVISDVEYESRRQRLIEEE